MCHAPLRGEPAEAGHYEQLSRRLSVTIERYTQWIEDGVIDYIQTRGDPW